MKENLKTANLKQDHADQCILLKADEAEILLDDDKPIVAVKIEFKRKILGFSPSTAYNVWLREGIKEENGRCEDYIIIHAMTLDNTTVITMKSNISKLSPIGKEFRYLNFFLERRNKDGKDYFVIK